MIKWFILYAHVIEQIEYKDRNASAQAQNCFLWPMFGG